MGTQTIDPDEENELIKQNRLSANIPDITVHAFSGSAKEFLLRNY